MARTSAPGRWCSAIARSDFDEVGAHVLTAAPPVRPPSGWPDAPRPVPAGELLPERALAGEARAKGRTARDLLVATARPNPVLATAAAFLEADRQPGGQPPGHCSSTPTPCATA